MGRYQLWPSASHGAEFDDHDDDEVEEEEEDSEDRHQRRVGSGRRLLLPTVSSPNVIEQLQDDVSDDGNNENNEHSHMQDSDDDGNDDAAAADVVSIVSREEGEIVEDDDNVDHRSSSWGSSFFFSHRQQKRREEWRPWQRDHQPEEEENEPGGHNGPIVEYVVEAPRYDGGDDGNDVSVLTFQTAASHCPDDRRRQQRQQLQLQQQQHPASSSPAMMTRRTVQQQHHHHHHHYHISIPPEQAREWMALQRQQQQNQQQQQQQQEDDDDDDVMYRRQDTMRSTTRRWWTLAWTVAVLAVATHVAIVAWYGPAVPPRLPPVVGVPSRPWSVEYPSSSSYHADHADDGYDADNWHEQGRRTTTAQELLAHRYIDLAYHVGYWSWSGAYRDVWEHGIRAKLFLLLGYRGADSGRNDGDDGDGDDGAENGGPRFPTQWNLLPSSSSLPGSSAGRRRPAAVAIYGQDAALERVEERLNGWMAERRATSQLPPSDLLPQQRPSPAAPHRRQRPRLLPGPVVFYVTGGRGVGKRSLAYLLLDQMIETTMMTKTPCAGTKAASTAALAAAPASSMEQLCGISDGRRRSGHYGGTPSATAQCPLLHITMADLKDCKDGQSSFAVSSAASSPLYLRIVEHARNHRRGGSILLLDRIDWHGDADDDGDDDEFNASSWFVPSLMKEIQSQPAIFHSMIVVMTSSVGTATVEKWMRKQSQQVQQSALPAITAEGESLLRYDLKEFHFATSHGSQLEDATSDWTIIPMMTLDRAAMTAILRDVATTATTRTSPSSEGGTHRRPSPWTGIQDEVDANASNQDRDCHRRLGVSDAAADRILDALEWNQWIHKTTGRVLRTWSPGGAHPLLQLWDDRVEGTLRRNQCLEAAHVEGRWDRPGNGEDRVVLHRVLDLDDRSSTDQFAVKACLAGRNLGSDSRDQAPAAEKLDYDWLPCQDTITTCRFYI